MVVQLRAGTQRGVLHVVSLENFAERRPLPEPPDRWGNPKHCGALPSDSGWPAGGQR